MQLHHRVDLRHFRGADDILTTSGDLGSRPAQGERRENRLPFVDAHFHLWEIDRLRYPWLAPPFDDAGPNGSVATIARDYLVADYRRDAQAWNVVGAVHVEAGARPSQSIEETLWLEGLAGDEGLPSAIVAHAPLDDPAVEPLLAAHAAHPHVRGIRQIVNWHADPRRTYTSSDMTTDPQWWRGFALLGRHGLSFDLQCYPGQMEPLAAAIRSHEEVAVIVNHLGMPVLTDPDGITAWRVGIRALAAVPQTSIKLSGFGFVDPRWTCERILPFLTETVDAFGPDRCLFASDAPTDKLFAPFDACLDTLERFSAGFSDDERRAMWGGNANRVYRLGLDLEGTTACPIR